MAQYLAGIGFTKVSADMVEEVTYLASQRQGLMLSAQDLNLALRMSLFSNPNPQNALVALFPEQRLAEGFCDDVQIYGSLINRAKAVQHAVDANIARDHTAPTIAFTAAGRQQRDVQTFVLQVDVKTPVEARLTDRLVAGQKGSCRVAGDDVVQNGLFVLEYKGSQPVERNLGKAPEALSGLRLFYQLGSPRDAGYCAQELAHRKLGQAAHWPRL